MVGRLGIWSHCLRERVQKVDSLARGQLNGVDRLKSDDGEPSAVENLQRRRIQGKGGSRRQK